MDELKAGDIVVLKGYKVPIMVIERITDVTDAGMATGNKEADCHWITEEKYHYMHKFNTLCLKKVKERGETDEKH